MTTTEPEFRYFQHVHDLYAFAITPQCLDDYIASPDYHEVLLVRIPEIEVGEPDGYGGRAVTVDGVGAEWIYPCTTASVERKDRDADLAAGALHEAIARWIDAPPPTPPERPEVQAARDALALLTDEERAEVVR